MPVLQVTLNGGGGSGGSTGDVAGPSSSVDNALVRYDGATGKVLQGGVIVETDAGALLLPSGSTSLPALSFASDPATGAYLISANNLGFVSNGVLVFDISSGRLAANKRIDVNETGAGNGASLRSLGSATTPSLLPDWNDPDTGVGTAGPNQVSLIAGGLEIARVGTSGLAALRPVEASTAGVGAPNLLAALESRKLLTNEGATAEAYNTLPASSPVGCEFSAYCADTDGIRITAPTGETIRTGPGAVSATGGFIRSVSIGSGITLTKINATSWVAINAPNGTWTIDV